MKLIFFDIYKNHKKLFYVTLFVAIISASADIASGVVQKNILDSLSSLKNFSMLAYLLVLLFWIYGINQIFWALTFYCSHKYGSYVSQIYKKRALEKFHKVKYSLILDKKEWEVHEIIWGWVDSIAQVVDKFFGHVLQNTLMILFWLIVLWYVDIYIFLYFSCFFIPVFIVYSIFWIKKRVPNAKKLTDEKDTVSGQVVEYLSHIRDIKIFWVQNIFIKKFKKDFLDIFNLEMKIEKSHHSMNFFQFLILIWSMCFVLLYTGNEILQWIFTLGTFLLVYHVFNSIRFALWWLVFLYRDFEENFIRIRKLLDFFSWEEDQKKSFIQNQWFQKLEVQNLSFTYATGNQILKNINFSISHGEKIALIGKSGEWKTTFISIILWLLEWYTGKILYNSWEVYGYMPEVFSYVPQDTKIFNDTIRFNLTMGEEFSDDELRNILEQVWLSYLQNRKESWGDILDIHVWASWLKLSGGERQRLGIARAMIRQRDIYIFDEITSNLDEDTEHDILSLIFKIITDKTCIIITHKKQVLEKVDRVYEMKQWQIKIFS